MARKDLVSSVGVHAGDARLEDIMKTGPIIALTAGGALGALLLGGGAFAAGATIGADIRDERGVAIQRLANHGGDEALAGWRNARERHQGDSGRGEHDCDGEREKFERGAQGEADGDRYRQGHGPMALGSIERRGGAVVTP